MQPSTWDNTNQHWVPQFLLKGFGIRGDVSRVWELDKEDGSIQRHKVKDVASKPALLPQRDDELMRIIEARATQPIRNIRKRKIRKLSERDRRAIDQLVAAMMLNDPYSGFDLDKVRQELIESESMSSKEDMEYWGGTVDLRTMEEIIDENFPHDYLTMMMEGQNGLVLPMLQFMGLRAVYSEEGESFVIGDSPILLIRNDGPTGHSLLNPGSQVILPIGWQCVLVYDWSTGINLIQKGTTDRRQVVSLNQDYCQGSNCRYLYGRNEDCLDQSRGLKLHWENSQRSTEVNNGWLAMQQFLGKAQAMEVEGDEQDRKNRRFAALDLVITAHLNEGFG